MAPGSLLLNVYLKTYPSSSRVGLFLFLEKP